LKRSKLQAQLVAGTGQTQWDFFRGCSASAEVQVSGLDRPFAPQKWHPHSGEDLRQAGWIDHCHKSTDEQFPKKQLVHGDSGVY